MDDILKKLKEIEKINPNQLTGISFNDYLWLVSTVKFLYNKSLFFEQKFFDKLEEEHKPEKLEKEIKELREVLEGWKEQVFALQKKINQNPEKITW